MELLQNVSFRTRLVYLLLIVGVMSSLAEAQTWTHVGPTGGRILELAVDPSNSSIVYAGTDGAGIFKSTNRGETWQPSSSGLISVAKVNAIIIVPGTPSTLYAAGLFSFGVFKSTDGGDSWTTVNNGLSDLRVYCLTVNPADSSHLYAGTWQQGVFQTTDAGATWTNTSTGLPAGTIIFCLAVDPSNPTTVFAGTTNGLFRSVNGGTSWQSASTGITYSGIEALAVDPGNSNIVYAGVGTGGVFKSLDGGNTWNPSGSGTSGRTISHLFFDPGNSSVLYAGGGGLYKTTDSGATWNSVLTSFPTSSSAVEGMAIDPNNPINLYAAFWHDGVYKTSDGAATWSRSSQGLLWEGVGALALDSSDPETLLAGTAQSGGFRSTDMGRTWNPASEGMLSGNANALVSDPETAGLFYAATFDGVFRTVNGGESWSNSSNGLGGTFWGSLAIDPNNPAKLWVGSSVNGVYRSENSGTDWTMSNTGLTPGAIDALAKDSNGEGALFAGGPQGIFKSVDGAKSWTVSTAALPTKSLAVLPGTPSTVLAGTDSLGVRRSEDGGTTWAAVDTLGTPASVRALAASPIREGLVFAGTSWGVYRSADSGAHWVPLPQGLEGSSIWSVAASKKDPWGIYAGTETGVHKFVPLQLNFAQFGDGDGLFSQFILFSLDDSSDALVQLKVRDNAGSLLNTDLNGQTIAGEQWTVVPAGGLERFKSDGLGTMNVGSATATTDQALGGVILFGGSMGLAGVGGSPVFEEAFLAPIENNELQGISTGIAVMNLENRQLTGQATLYAPIDGTTLAEATFTVPPFGHEARFSSQFTWDSPVNFSDMQALLKVDVDGKCSATVIQVRPGQLATMPVSAPISNGPSSSIDGGANSDLIAEWPGSASQNRPLEGLAGSPRADGSQSLNFAQFGDGEGLFSQLLLFNLDPTQKATVEIRLRDGDGELLPVDLNGQQVNGLVNTEIPGHGLARFKTDGKGTLVVGSVTVTTDTPLGGVILFGGASGLAGVGSSSPSDQGFRAPMETNSASQINTGIAIMNLENRNTLVSATLVSKSGQSLATAQFSLSPNGHKALFINQFSWNTAVDFTAFEGVLLVTVDGKTSATVIQTRPGQLATMPVELF